MPRAGYVPLHTHQDPAVAGFDVSSALGDLDRLAAHLDGINGLVERETDQTRADAKSDWTSTAGQSRRNLRDRLGRLRTTYRTGKYKEAIRSKVFREEDGSVSGKVFVIQGDWSAHPGTKWPKNLPLWLEHGTAKMDPRPHLIPAFERAKRRLSAAIERLVQGAV
jgi:hypothetical protein